MFSCVLRTIFHPPGLWLRSSYRWPLRPHVHLFFKTCFCFLSFAKETKTCFPLSIKKICKRYPTHLTEFWESEKNLVSTKNYDLKKWYKLTRELTEQIRYNEMEIRIWISESLTSADSLTLGWVTIQKTSFSIPFFRLNVRTLKRALHFL